MDQKAPEAFRTISEVADELDVPQHVLRFWETRFHEIRPMKRGGGRRYYRPDDVDLLRGIRHLLYGEGYTIRGVQRILSEEGQKFVQAVWHSGAPQPPHRGSDVNDAEYEDDIADDEIDARAAAPPPPQIEPRFEARPEPRVEPRIEPRIEPRVSPPVVSPSEMPDPNIGLRDTLTSFIGRDLNARDDDVRREPVIAPPHHLPPQHLPPPVAAPTAAAPSTPQAYSPAPAYPAAHPTPHAPQAFPTVPPVVQPAASPYVPYASQPVAPMPPRSGDFAREDLRRLQAALHELAECKKLLTAMSGS